MSLETSLIALFQAPFDDTDNVTAKQLVLGYAAMFEEIESFGIVNDAINPTTQDLLERYTAGDLFVVTCMAACFAALAEGAAAKAQGGDYATAEEVDGDMLLLARVWDALAERSLDADTRSQLTEIFARISSILTALEVTLPRISVVDVPTMPASVLAYMLYDSDERTAALVNLNPTLPPWLYDGDASVLTE